jgi:arylsulfatase A-like enzyme
VESNPLSRPFRFNLTSENRLMSHCQSLSRNVRRRLRYLLACIAPIALMFALGAAAADAAPPAAGKYNVLFLIADDLNCDLGCYGHPLVKTPNIDRLASRGMRFERAYCQFPLCGPSRASFLCGLYPDQTLVQANSVFVRDRVPNVLTLPQHFRNHGYTPVRVGKLYHYGVPGTIGTDGHDDPPSWDRKFNPRGRDKDDESKVFTLVPGQYGGTLSWLAADGEDAEQTDGIGAGMAVKLLEEFAGKQPFFLAVGFYRPHTPYVSPKSYFEKYPRENISVPQVPQGYLKTLPEPAVATLGAKKVNIDLADETKREAMQGYYAAITFMDAQLGRVLDALERVGLADNTIVLMTSDHGYHMGEHGHFQKMTLFENAAHVPLIVSVPGMKNAGGRSRSLVEMVDYYPTLAELCGLPLPKHLAGVSQARVLDDPAAQPRIAALTKLPAGYTLRTDRYRYTEWGMDGVDGAELYDHQSDPQELMNLATDASHSTTVADLSKQLRERIAQAKKVPEGLTQIILSEDDERKAKQQQRRAKQRAEGKAS